MTGHQEPPDEMPDERDLPSLDEALRLAETAPGRAASLLGHHDDPRARAILRQFLTEGDWGARHEAALSLGRLRDEEAVPALIDALDDAHEDVRWSAALALVEIWTPAAQAAIRSLRSGAHRPDDARLRLTLYGALRHYGRLSEEEDREARADIGGLVTHDEPPVRVAAVRELGSIGDADAVPVLARALQDDDHSVRSFACEALLKINTPDAEAALEPFRRGDENARDPIVRLTLYLGLRDAGRLRPGEEQEAWARMRGWLTDEDPFVRMLAASELGKARDDKAVSALAQVLNDPQWTVRSTACRALVRIWTPEAQDALRRLAAGDIRPDDEWLRSSVRAYLHDHERDLAKGREE
jgi:HEAT repeat protein